MRRNLFLRCLLRSAAVGILLLLAQPGKAADNPLNLFKNYFGTIDYVSKGLGLRGTGHVDSGPGGTGESLATGSISVTVPPGADIVAAFLYWEALEKTALPSSARGYLRDPSDPSARIQFLGKPLGAAHAAACWSNGGSTGASNGAPTLRVYRADILRYLPVDPITNKKIPSITVMLRDSGSGGNTAPLTEGASLVVVYRDPTLPFKSVVIFDGSTTTSNADGVFSQTIYGFYQAKAGTAKMTHIVGDGQSNFPELLYINGTLRATNPFTGTAGDKWDNLDYNVTMAQDASSVTTRVDHGSGSFDCLSWGAIVFSTAVQDTDSDGLLDIWETSGFRSPTAGPAPGTVLVPLNLMGANPNVKDIFIEIDHMAEFLDDADGTHHVHKPKKEALEMVYKAFRDAPVSPAGPGPINVHFDVGNTYQETPPLPYIIPAALAQGGQVIDERSPATYCTTYVAGPPARCLYPHQPGLISWQKGWQHLKNHFFSDDRNFTFHYFVFGHALAKPALGSTLPPFIASSVSGRAQLPGGGGTVTLGKWRSNNSADAQVGSKELQASTLMHEIGHMIGLRHPAPNCNPNQLSSENYLYQAAGLLDRDGNYRIDYSREALAAPIDNPSLGTGAQDESGLDEFRGLGAGPDTKYRLRWYAPVGIVETRLGLPSGTITAAKAFCDGSARVTNSGVVRVDGRGVARLPVDWNYNRATVDHPNLDINFNGTKAEVTKDFAGSNEWLAISLQQISSGRNLYGLSLGVGAQDLLRLGEDDLGEDDLGAPQLGEDDLGEDDLGEDDLGEDDLGEDDLGQVSDIDLETATAIGNAPSALIATVPPGPASIVLNWNPPAVGSVVRYTIYRSDGSDAAPPLTTFGPFFGSTPGSPPPTTFIDSTTRNNRTYTYFVIAGFDDSTQSNPSNLVTIRQ